MLIERMARPVESTSRGTLELSGTPVFRLPSVGSASRIRSAFKMKRRFIALDFLDAPNRIEITAAVRTAG